MRCALTFLVAASLAQPTHAASPAAGASARLLAQVEPRIKAIYETDEFRMRSFHATWLPDGSGYLKLETPDGASAAEIARYDSASGQRTVVVASEKLLIPGTSERLRLRSVPPMARYLSIFLTFARACLVRHRIGHFEEHDIRRRIVQETRQPPRHPEEFPGCIKHLADPISAGVQDFQRRMHRNKDADEQRRNFQDGRIVELIV